MSNRKSWMTGLGLAALLLVLLNLPEKASRTVKSAVREAAAPPQSLWAGLSLRAHEAWATLRGIGGLSSRNAELESELLQARAELRQLQAFREENEALRAQLGYAARSPQRLISAEVIARDASGWWQSLRLGQGTRDGIAPNRAVVTPDGLVGRTIEVTPRTADVLLISDPSSRISVEVPRIRAFGILHGEGVRADGQVTLRINFLDRHASLQPGDEVVTSGMGGVFPRGIPIGRVEIAEANDPESLGLYQSASVAPRVELGALRQAFVMADPPEPTVLPQEPRNSERAP